MTMTPHLDMIETSSGLVSAIRNNLRRVLTLRREIGATNPDIVIAFGDLTNVRSLLATIPARRGRSWSPIGRPPSPTPAGRWAGSVH
jgi:hypothetical protein